MPPESTVHVKASKPGHATGAAFLNTFLSLMERCSKSLKQRRTGQRASDFILGLLLATGRKTCQASRNWRNLTDDDSADYKVFSRSEWDVRDWYYVVLKEVLDLLPPGVPLFVAMDDTGLRKWGKTVPQARYIHDPLALKWLKQRFTWGIRVLNLAAILPFEFEAGRPYAVPVGFYPKPAARKPRRREVSEESLAAYQAAKRESLLTKQGRNELENLRAQMNKLGAANRKLIAVVDGSFMNGPVAKKPIPGVEIVGRVRGTARLRERLMPQVGKTFYGDLLPTPEEFLHSRDVRWRSTVVYHGGLPRAVKFKVIPEVYWKDGTGKRPMRLIVVQGNPYRPKQKRRNRLNKRPNWYFRDPGYLLSTDLVNEPEYLLQGFAARWQIEDLNRIAKTGLGAAHPQNTNFHSVERLPSALVAAYALLQLAALKTFGPNWNQRVVPQTRSSWRKMRLKQVQGRPLTRRYSHRDLIMLLRNEVERAGMFEPNTLPSYAPRDWVLSARDTFNGR